MVKPRALTLLVLISCFVGVPSVVRADGPATAYGKNLVINGDAERELGAPDSGKVVKPSGWETTGQFTAVQYGASGGFPDAKSPGPDERGKSLFEGGNVPRSTAHQTIALKTFGSDIDAGNVSYDFSAWLGGFGSQGDQTTVSVQFLGAAGAKLAVETLGPISPAQRKSITSLIRASHSGKVPKGTRSASISVALTRFVGTYNDGSVDDVTLVLHNGTP